MTSFFSVFFFWGGLQ